MIKYTFFFNEGNISSTISEEQEDIRLQESLASTGILELPNEKFDLYVNMALVKCTAREVIDANAAVPPEAPVQSQESGSN